MPNETRKTRRAVTKSLVASGGAIILGKSIPQSWISPVVDAVVLPVHAQTSPLFDISCNVEVTDGDCNPDGIEFRVFGSVSGGDLEGVVLEIEYSNQSENTGCSTSSVTTTTVVQAGNTFDETVLALPPSGDEWCDEFGEVCVRFQDQSTFGTAECCEIHNCEEEESP
jgi:hypothetical protein